MGGGSRYRDALLVARRIATSSWSSPASIFAASRGYSGTAADTNDEFWVVEGEILRIKRHQSNSLFKLIDKHSPSQTINLNLSRRQVANARLQRVQATRLSQSAKGQEEYFKTYMERFRNVREQWEKLFWDGIPDEPVLEKVDPNDPFTILGLKRREKPYSPVELKSAYREMALKFHPDHNPGKDAEAKFERIWNAYKMLQHRRSWK